MENRIPKIIHYCWFGGKKPKKVVKTIKKWKSKLPDYSFIEWNENNFDIEKSCDFVKEAYVRKKWAFVSDYVRLYALQMFGGIYLDTDVQLLKTFDLFLNDPLFISHESNRSLCTAVIGSIKQNSLIEAFLNTYLDKKFELNKNLNITPNSELLFDFCKQNKKNIEFDKEFVDETIHVYPQTFFCAKDIHNYKLLVSSYTICIHNLDASWYSPSHLFFKKIKVILMKFINFFRR